MERSCPVCGHHMRRHDIVCHGCRERIERREPVRREEALYAWGRGLMFCLAFFFFIKSALATFGPRDYQALTRSMGFEAVKPTFYYLNAAFVSAAALLYAIAWLGGYLKLRWEAGVCLAALVVFVAGQGVTQFVSASGEGGLARAAALFVVWIAVPVCQFCALVLGEHHEEPPPPRPAASDAQAAS